MHDALFTQIAAEEAGHLACPPAALELLAILLAIPVTAEKQQQRKQLHKQRQVEAHSL
jgi:hypothetical protein